MHHPQVLLTSLVHTESLVANSLKSVRATLLSWTGQVAGLNVTEVGTSLSTVWPACNLPLCYPYYTGLHLVIYMCISCA
jgi:hypothetical protein